MVKARVAGAFYLVTFVAGITSLLARGRFAVTAALIAGACYVVVTLLFYDLFKPVNTTVSLLAAVVSLAGIAVGPLQLKAVHPLVFFGLYCLLIGYLVFKSRFLPRAVGVLMAFSAVGWLTYFSPSVGMSLYPYNLAPGVIGEGALTLWLLVKGLDVERWAELRGTMRQPLGRAATRVRA